MPDFKILNDEPKTEGKKGKGTIKNLLKKKPFLIAVAVVSVLGLYSWFKKSNTPEEGQNIVVADGLSGVPISQIPVGEGYDTSYTSDSYDALYQAFSDELSNMEKSYDVVVNDMYNQLTLLSNRYDTQSYVLEKQSEEIARQNDIQAMMSNSDAWYYATTTERKNALNEANKEIASKWGWSFNDGTWYDENGTQLYRTVTQDAVGYQSATVESKKATTTKSSGSSGGSSSKVTNSVVNRTANNVSTANDIAKMQANSTAWNQTSDKATKDKLHAENKAIASKNNWTFEGSTGRYKDSKGNYVY